MDLPLNSSYNFIKEGKKMPRFRTIRECLEMLKEIDDNTAITENFIRTLCNEQKVHYFNSGNKSLVNFDSLLAFLNEGGLCA